MVYKRIIKNQNVFATAIEVKTFDQAAGGYVGGRFAGAYKLDEPPGWMIAGAFVKDAQGKTALFANRDDAFEAAFQAAEVALP